MKLQEHYQYCYFLRDFGQRHLIKCEKNDSSSSSWLSILLTAGSSKTSLQFMSVLLCFLTLVLLVSSVDSSKKSVIYI